MSQNSKNFYLLPKHYKKYRSAGPRLTPHRKIKVHVKIKTVIYIRCTNSNSATHLFWKCVSGWLHIVNDHIDLFTNQFFPEEFSGFEQPRHIKNSSWCPWFIFWNNFFGVFSKEEKSISLESNKHDTFRNTTEISLRLLESFFRRSDARHKDFLYFARI